MTTRNNKVLKSDLISLLYVHDTGTFERFSEFSKEEGFVLETCNDFKAACDLAKFKQPDLIIIESDNDAPLPGWV